MQEMDLTKRTSAKVFGQADFMQEIKTKAVLKCYLDDGLYLEKTQTYTEALDQESFLWKRGY